MNPLIFLSYSSKDKLIADAICSRLENQNIRCWIAPRDVNPGADYSNQIADALELSTVMVMVFSSGSNSSRHVKSEIDRAFSLGKVIIPFRVENVELDKGLAYYLAKTHWLDAVTKPLDQHIDRLAGTIRQVAGVEPVPVSQIRPPEPAPPASSRESTKAPWIVAGIALVVCAIIAAGGLMLFWLSQKKSEAPQAATAPPPNLSAQNAPAPTSSPSTPPEWEAADNSPNARSPEEDAFVGTWKIAEAMTLAGKSYGGAVEIGRSGPRYRMQWRAAGSDFSGIALAVGNQICAVFGSDVFGVLHYRIHADGTLKGRWASSVFSADDRDAFENATGGSPGKVEGTYSVKGLNSDGTNYQGKLKIVKTGQTFQLEWDGFGSPIKGVGIRVGDGLFVATGDKSPLGVVSYTIDGARAKGVWTLAGETAVGTENLTK